MKTYFVVTGVLIYKDEILLLKKAPDDYNYPSKWSFCSGYIKEFESGEDTVLREIKEETGINAKITKVGKIIQVVDKKNSKTWVIGMYLCEADKKEVKLCNENVEFSWVKEEDIKKYDFVPGLEQNLNSLGLAR